MSHRRIYLDYNATSPLLPVAREAMIEAMDLQGNPSSVHAEGRASRAAVEKARRQVARLVGAKSADVVFTSGATEAAVTVLTPHLKMGKADLFVRKLLVGAADHPCLLTGGRFSGEQVEHVPVDQYGHVDLKALRTAIKGDEAAKGPVMVGVTLANNETGIIQPLQPIVDIVREFGGILVVDAVQAVGRIAVDLSELGADFLIVSSHKLGGPKGAGALVCASEILRPAPLISGGGQEKGHRSGTENPAALAGFGAAAEYASEHFEAQTASMLSLREKLEDGLRKIVPQCVIYGSEEKRIPNTTFFSVPGMKAETAQIAFDLARISVSAGSACSSGKVGPSHVLSAMGEDSDLGAIRVSLGPANTEMDIDQFLAACRKIVDKPVSV